MYDACENSVSINYSHADLLKISVIFSEFSDFPLILQYYRLPDNDRILQKSQKFPIKSLPTRLFVATLEFKYEASVS